MPGIGRKAAGRMADRRCEKVGMRFTMEPVVCCGKSDARAIGRKAARKEREGTAEIAAILGGVCGGWYAMRLVYGCCSRFHDNSLSPASVAASQRRARRDILLRAWAGGWADRWLSAAPFPRAAARARAAGASSIPSEPLGVAAAPACTFSCRTKRL